MSEKKNIIWYRSVTENTSNGIYKKRINLPITENCINIIQDLRSKGYLSLIVGGAVRDAVIGLPAKDIDIEVYGINYEQLSETLKQYGKVNLVGKAFGVIKLKDSTGHDYDFSVPRRDSKIENDPSQLGMEGGNRGRGIKAEFDTNISPKEAAERRDFTFNALAYDPINEEIHDYFGGINDINNGVMRATSEKFSEDPLRVLRGMQLISRLFVRKYEDNEIKDTPFSLDPDTAIMAKGLVNEPLVKERVSEEWMKLFTKGKFPGNGIQYLIDTGWISKYPELEKLINISQDPLYHPEGVTVRKNKKDELGESEPFDPNNPEHSDPNKYVMEYGNSLLEHTKYSLNAAAIIAEREGVKGDDRAVLIASVLGHDLGKSDTTLEEEKDGVTRITSKGHANLSGPLTKSFLESIGIKKEIINRSVPLSAGHMMHLDYDSKSKKMNVRQIAEKIFPATIKELMYVMESDHSGRPPLEGGLPEKARQILDDSVNENVYEGKIKPLLQGRDILPFFEEPGPLMGESLNYIYQQQLHGTIKTKEEAMKLFKDFLKKRNLFINGNDILSIIGGKGGPIIGQILSEVWEMQLSGQIKNKEEAIQWADENYGEEEVPKFSSKNMRYKTSSRYKMSSINRLKYFVELDKDKTFEEVAAEVAKYALEHYNSIDQTRLIAKGGETASDAFIKEYRRDGEGTYRKYKQIADDINSIKKSIDIKQTFGDISKEDLVEMILEFKKRRGTENPIPSIEKFREESDSDLIKDIDQFNRTAQAEGYTEYGAVDKTPQLGGGPTDYSDILGIWNEDGIDDAEEAIKMVPPEALNGVEFILTTDDSSIAGVYEPHLTVILFEKFLEQQGIKMEELSDEEKEYYIKYIEDLQNQNGLAFRISPQKINSEIEKLMSEVMGYSDYLKQQMSPEDFDLWVNDTKHKIIQLVIAEIIIHESTHAHGAKDEGAPVAAEKAFLSQAINRINSERETKGIFGIPLTTK